MSGSKRSLLFIIAVLLFAVTGTAFAASSSTDLPNGAQLDVTLDSPLTSTEYIVPAGESGRDVTVNGTASVGAGAPDVTLVYVVDVSGTTAGAGNCGLGGGETVLDCEVDALTNYTNDALAGGSVDEIGIVFFDSEAHAADMQPGGAQDNFTASAADVITVLNSAVPGTFTDFSAALYDAKQLVDAASNTYKFVLFLSDGLSNENEDGAFASRAAALSGSANTQVFTFAIGAFSSCTAGSSGTLAEIGPCTPTTTTDLAADLPDLTTTTLDEVRLSVNGSDLGAVATVPATPLTSDTPKSVTWSHVVQDLAPGDHELCAVATGHVEFPNSDPVSTDPACETIHVYQLSLAPENEINELGTPGQTHTVTATLAGPLGGLAPVGGRNITFTILSGPNASVPQTVGVTDAAGNAEFTYTAAQGNAGIGTDVIKACVTLSDPMGETACETVTKVWADSTAPEVTCPPTVNPGGRNVPKASKQNEDGFYELVAADATDPDPEIYVVTGGEVFGPFASGTRIKYTQAPGKTPSIKPMNGAVDYHIIGPDELQTYSVDSSGNQSDPLVCYVPPPPK